MQRPAVPRRQPGLRPPLFDRLFDLEANAADRVDARLLAAADLRRSVARHLGHLLDCRSPARVAGQELTVLDWGVPDLAALPPRDRRAQADWMADVRRALARFEPRLRDPQLELHETDDSGRSRLSIRGSLGAQDAAAPVLFELALEAASGGRMTASGARDDVLSYYQRELHYLRAAGGEFAAAFPKVASRLELGPDESSDPHVERLIESFAFLTGRVQRSIDGEFPRMTEALLGLLYPQLAATRPAAAVVRLAAASVPPAGLTVGRGAMLSARTADDLRCRFRTCYETRLWPIEAGPAELRTTDAWPFLDHDPTAAVLRVRLALDEGVSASVGGQPLRLFLGGAATEATRLYDLLVAGCDRVAFVADGMAPMLRGAADALRPVGFAPEEALLPDACRVHPAYALLQDYFAFPDKFRFVDLHLPTLPPCATLDVLFLLPAAPGALALSADSLQLGCTPVVNLFDQVAEPILIDQRRAEYKVVADARLEPVMEVHSITRVRGWRAEAEAWVDIRPYFAIGDGGGDGQDAAWLLRRSPAGGRAMGGGDVWLSLVDPALAAAEPAERTILAHCLCTNRQLAEQVPAGARLEFEEPAGGARAICLARPTAPRPAPAGGETAWRLISQLGLNYLSLSGGPDALAALREILLLHAGPDDAAARQQVLGLRALRCQPVTRRIGSGVRSALAQGLGITLVCDERRFAGGSALMLGAVLDRFLALHASVNAFTQLTLLSEQRQRIWHAWPPRTGAAPLV